MILLGGVAHLVEHLVRNQRVVGSSPIVSMEKKTDGIIRRFFCARSVLLHDDCAGDDVLRVERGAVCTAL